MNFAKRALRLTGPLSIAFIGPLVWTVFRASSEQKATGLGAVEGGVAAMLFSPLHWVLLLGLFGLLYAASELKNKTLSVLLFWIPRVASTGLAALVLTLFAIIWWHSSLRR